MRSFMRGSHCNVLCAEYTTGVTGMVLFGDEDTVREHLNGMED